MAVATTMERPEKVVLTYYKSNPMAKKALDFFLSLGLFQVQKITKSQVEIGLEEYRQGEKYMKCHVEPDWVLIWVQKDDEMILVFTNTGAHSNMFGM